jgi:hypothetical protein
MLKGFATSAAFSQNMMDSGKVYVSADKMIVSDKGIFILLENEDSMLTKVLVPQVNCDENGLFVLAEYIPLPQTMMERCPKFHPCACPICFGCNRADCPYRCKCPRR